MAGKPKVSPYVWPTASTRDLRKLIERLNLRARDNEERCTSYIRNTSGLLEYCTLKPNHPTVHYGAQDHTWKGGTHGNS